MQIVRMNDACAQLGICRSTMDRMVGRGELKKVIISPRCVGFRKSDLEALTKVQCGNECGTIIDETENND